MITRESFLRYQNIIKKLILPTYWAILTIILLKPNSDIKHDYWFIFNEIDKIVHISIFILLGLLLKLSFNNLSSTWFFTIGISYGLLTEIAQHLMDVGRTGDAIDLIADSIGFLIAFIIYKYIKL